MPGTSFDAIAAPRGCGPSCDPSPRIPGELQDAVPFYEQSETHRFEVPRMLFDDTLALEQYATQTKDR